jgi:hypothetical protein
MRASLIIAVVFLAVTLGLAPVSKGSLPRVIGNWEDSNDGWAIHPEAAAGTTAQVVKENATLGSYSYKVSVPSGWQKAIICDMMGEPNLLADFGKATKLQVDVTLKAKDWSVGSGWVKPIESIVIQSDMGGWQQIDPAPDQDLSWNSSEDKTFTAIFEIPPQTPPDLTHGSITIITNYDGVEKAGSFYFDNIKLLAAAESKKASELNKPAEMKKPAEPNKAK